MLAGLFEQVAPGRYFLQVEAPGFVRWTQEVKAGMSPHAPHTHPEEEFMVITEGTGEISMEGKITKVAPGSMMYCAGNKLHGIVNTGKTPLLFYFYKWQK